MIIIIKKSNETMDWNQHRKKKLARTIIWNHAIISPYGIMQLYPHKNENCAGTPMLTNCAGTPSPILLICCNFLLAAANLNLPWCNPNLLW